MQQFTSISEIKARADVIRLNLMRVARKVGVAPSTVHRGFVEGRRTYGITIGKLAAELVAEEIRLRDYLNELHPPGRDTRQ